MGMSPRLLRPRATGFDPRSISGLALWLDAADSQSLYTTDAGPVTAVNDPRDITGCVLWLDGADETSMFDATSGGSNVAYGNPVSRWQDKSGRNNHATATTTARPTLTPTALNGRSVMTFDGSANSMAVAANADFNSNNVTYFVVFRQTSTANKGVYTKLNATGGTLGFGLVVRSDPQVWLLQKNAGSQQILTNNVNPTTATRIYTVTSSSSAVGYQDGLQAATGSATADHSLNQTVRIGSREGVEFFNGYIAEIIHYNAVLSTADRARVEAYLAAKWGISGVHTQATATNDPVGYWRDRSGNGRHATQTTGSRRPLLTTSGINGGRSLVTDNVDDVMSLGNISSAFSSQAGTGFFVFKTNGTDNIYTVLKTRANNPVTFENSGGNFRTFSGVWRTTRLNAVPFRAPNAISDPAIVHTLQASTSAYEMRTNGALLVSAAGDWNAGATYELMGDSDGGSYFSGIFAEAVLYSRFITTAERQRVERYLASKWGITLAPQVSNADAQDWINRVYANGGTVSTSTANAVNTFCNDIDAAGIRDRFYRLSLFCGDNLLAALVPLYRAESSTATVRGNSTDTNTGAFVSGNYTPTSGLQNNNASGNGSNYLNTGVPMNFSSLRNYHLSAFVFARNTAHNYYAIGADTNTDGVLPRMLQAIAGNNTSPLGYVWYNVGTDFIQPESASNSYLPALFTGVGGTSANNLYVGGSSVASAAAAANETNTRTLPIFVFSYNRNSSALSIANIRMGGYSIGLSLTAAQVAAYNTAFAAFNTAIGRT